MKPLYKVQSGAHSDISHLSKLNCYFDTITSNRKCMMGKVFSHFLEVKLSTLAFTLKVIQPKLDCHHILK